MLDNAKANLLLDYYEDLLTSHQISILNDYFKDDLSMSEIAENNHISKAAVSDIIKRSVKSNKCRSSMKLLDRGYKLKIRLFRFSPNLYLSLYHVHKS